MGRVEGKVAFITGAARGQGRAHAVRLAEEGADIIAVDICRPIETVDYQPATEDDLAETGRLVKSTGQSVVTEVVDVRDFDALNAALSRGVQQLGHLDIVIANAGIMAHPGKLWEFTAEQWQTTVDVNMTGVWHTIKAVAPVLIKQNTGGSIILTSSTAGANGSANFGHYAATKHAVLGLAKSAGKELGEYNIRVNSILPTSVDTPLIQFQELYNLFRPDLDTPTRDEVASVFNSMHLLPQGWLQPSDIADAALWLASEESKFVTGLELRVDAGARLK
ncbi:mycofactocin-coupled SDR family oxidoreductase [Gordonia sp. DT30]|uniref:mycofactocin-coupled SDR family oxidoreductase n=1 Tax=Gordonia sp. DT30 TaxID=3416546 RepID=UPI003CEA0959